MADEGSKLALSALPTLTSLDPQVLKSTFVSDEESKLAFSALSARHQERSLQAFRGWRRAMAELHVRFTPLHSRAQTPAPTCPFVPAHHVPGCPRVPKVTSPAPQASQKAHFRRFVLDTACSTPAGGTRPPEADAVPGGRRRGGAGEGAWVHLGASGGPDPCGHAAVLSEVAIRRGQGRALAAYVGTSQLKRRLGVRDPARLDPGPQALTRYTSSPC